MMKKHVAGIGDVDMTPEEEAAWLAESEANDPIKNPPPERVLENISKNIIWERMTEQEAAQADALLKAQPAKILRIYEGATYISVKADLYPQLFGAMAHLFGEKRAGEILEPNF